MTKPTPADRNDSMPWHRSGKWLVSPWNFRPEVTSSFTGDGLRDVLVVDSTLRSICTSEPGTAVTPSDLVEIAQKLDAVGVREAVFNISHTGSISGLAYAGAKACIDARLPRLKITSGCSLLPLEWRAGLDKAMEAGVRHLEVSYGATLLTGFTGTPKVYDLLHEAVEYVRTQGAELSIGFNVHQDTELEFLLRFFELGAEHEPRFIRLYDTKTSLGPHGMGWLVRTVLDHLGGKAPGVVIHTHNSWGLASATTIAGVLAGARGIDAAILAVGTKSGHTPMEETLLALEALYGASTGVDLEGIADLTHTVERILGIPIHPSKPVVGANAVICEQGPSVVEALEERMRGRPALTPFAPSAVGLAKRVVWGKNTLKPYVVATKLRELGLPDAVPYVDAALDVLGSALEAVDAYPAWLEDEVAGAMIVAACEPLARPS